MHVVEHKILHANGKLDFYYIEFLSLMNKSKWGLSKQFPSPKNILTDTKPKVTQSQWSLMGS